MKIEKKIPLPTARTNWPFAKMEVGDSFIVPVEKLISCRGAASAYSKNHPCVRFTVRTMDGKVRCWRTA